LVDDPVFISSKAKTSWYGVATSNSNLLCGCMQCSPESHDFFQSKLRGDSLVGVHKFK
jgi:hypothetical protein